LERLPIHPGVGSNVLQPDGNAALPGALEDPMTFQGDRVAQEIPQAVLRDVPAGNRAASRICSSSNSRSRAPRASTPITVPSAIRGTASPLRISERLSRSRILLL